MAAQSLAGRVRQVLDGLMIAASLLLVSWVLVLSPLFRSGGDNLLSQAISLAYPIGDVVARASCSTTAVRLGQSLQLVTVAEGVEDSAQFLTLRRMGCDIGQGYYFGRPMEAADMERLLSDELSVTKTPVATE